MLLNNFDLNEERKLSSSIFYESLVHTYVCHLNNFMILKLAESAVKFEVVGVA